MPIDITTDGHVHTRFCQHARGEMKEYVEAAVAKGLGRIVFLEHFEIGIKYPERTWLDEEDFKRYFEEGARLRQEYAGRIEVGLGVEVGYNPRRIKETLTFLRGYQWDRIGVSYHYFEINGSHYNVVSRKPYNMEALEDFGLDRVVHAYFSRLREAVEKLPGTVLCHLDAVLRHHPGINSFDRFLPLIRDVLNAMAAWNMALEVNTSGYPLRDEPYPGKALLREALGRGLSLTPGSDAHRPQDVGRYFDQLSSLLTS